jgi:hypothetical protein
MRTRSIDYFLRQLNKNNSKKGPKSQSEVINQELAEFYFAQKKETKKVA